MLTVYLTREGCEDIREFRTKEEFEEWLKRQMVIQPTTEILKIEES